MGLFGTKKAPPRAGRVIRASGLRIDLGADKGRDTIKAISATRQDWQSDAWGYRDQIGELRFAVQFLARAVSRVKFMPAQVMPGEDEPIPLDADKAITVPAALRAAAQEELARLPLDSGYAFLGVFAENLEITGEAWLHGYPLVGGGEKWDIRSVDEVRASQDGKMTIRTYGSSAQEPVTAAEEMIRMWVPHPRYKILADSPMRALLAPCEELILAGREMRAASRSRFAANGILLVPEGLTLLNALKEDSDLLEDNTFMADLAAVLLAPIANEGDPGAVVPAMVSGAIDDLAAVRHMRMEREDSATLLDKIDKALARLARGLDIPPEIVTGMADANHWTAWQIDASTYRHHIDPLVRIVADSLTEGFLRPALLARGFPEAEVRRVQVWYDAGNITENPNRGEDAKAAYDRGAIGMEPLRQALGFNEADAPSDEEILQMVAFKIGIDTNTSGLLLQALFGTKETASIQPVPATSERVQPEQLPRGEEPTGQPATAETAVPAREPGQASAGADKLVRFLLAAGQPEEAEDDWTVDAESGRKLMEIDRAERDRLLMAADAALTRALEVAGARIRSKAQKNSASKASVAGFASTRLASKLGREAIAELGLDEEKLVGDGIDALAQKFVRWVESAILNTIAVVLALLRIDADSDRGRAITERLTNSMSGRIDSAWDLFRAAMLKLADEYLYNPHPDQEPGEAPDVIVPPGLVRGVFAHVGGLHPDTGDIDDEGTPGNADRPVGGIALGNDVAEVLADEGAQELGFEWVYGITAIRHFEPHKDLNGMRFASWKDPRLEPEPEYAWVGPIFQPGDHNGCMCDYVPSYAIRERGQIVAERLANETPGASGDRFLAEGDDRAGRKGTDAQIARDERNRILKLQDRWIKEGQS